MNSQICAVKKRNTKTNGWMPSVVYVQLEGRPGKAGFLMICGWSAEPDKKGWPAPRLAKQLAKINKQWADDYGKGWKLEISRGLA